MKPYEFKINREKNPPIYRLVSPEARGSYMQSILEPQGFKEEDAKEACDFFKDRVKKYINISSISVYHFLPNLLDH